MFDFEEMGKKENILKVLSQNLFTVIDDIPDFDKKSNTLMKELAKLFLEEIGNKYSPQEIVVKFMTPEMATQEFKGWLKDKEELTKSMGL